MRPTRLRYPAQILALSLAVGFAAACATGGRLLARANSQTGIASWYGPNFHGRKTSNCEVYNMYEMTAAHPTLPFGTRVLVTNMDNGRAAEVRINDRGPFAKNRIIDLSYAAARLLGMVGPGTAPVRLDILSVTKNAPGGRCLVQIGSFTDRENARELVEKIGDRYGKAFISPVVRSGRFYYRVRLRAGEKGETELLAARLSAAGYPVLVCEAD